MATTETLSVTLPQELAAMVRHAVERGEYASASEVVESALQDMLVPCTVLEACSPEVVRRLWEEGLQSGPGRIGLAPAALGEEAPIPGTFPTSPMDALLVEAQRRRTAEQLA